MTTTVLGKTRFNIKGQWDAATAYTIDDLVMHDGGWYRAKGSVTAGTTPQTTASWDNIFDTFHWRGTHNYVNGTEYEVGDIVEFTFTSTYEILAGTVNAIPTERQVTQTFICISDHTINTATTPLMLPTNSTLWQPFVFEQKVSTYTNTLGEEANDKYGIYGEDSRKALWFANEGIIFEQHPQYVKGYKNHIDSRYNAFWIDGAGGVRSAGYGNNGSTGWNGQNTGPDVATLSFIFNDWFASIDNGGTGLLTTPDGKPPRAVQIEFGIDHGTVLFNNGEVHAWGYNGNYEVGDGTTTNRWMPYRVGGTYGEVAVQSGANTLKDIKIIRISQACGNGAANNDSVAAHTLALDSNGQVWAWGYNGYGQCGTGDAIASPRPYKIPQSYFNNEKVVAIWAFAQNYGVSYAYTENNKLYAWGYNNYGQLGNGNTTNQNRPVLINIDFTNVSIGHLVKFQFQGNQNYHSAGFLTSTGKVYTTGYNGSGTLCQGNTTNISAFTLVASGPGSNGTCENFWMTGGSTQGSAFFLSNADYKLYGVGYNGVGNLGDGSATNRSSAVECLRRVNGSSISFNANAKVKQVRSTGGNQYYSLMVLTDESRIYAAGWCNFSGLADDPSYAYQLQASNSVVNKEYENNLYNWFPIQTSTVMTGKDDKQKPRCESIMPCGGCDVGSTHYGAWLFRSSNGRIMTSAHENAASVGSNHGYTWGSNGGWRKARMGDVMQNG